MEHVTSRKKIKEKEKVGIFGLENISYKLHFEQNDEVTN